MAYLGIALAIIITAMLLLFLVVARRHRRLTPRLPNQPLRLSPQAQLMKLQTTGRYRGIKVESHCSASSHLVGREYEFEDAPALPASGCDTAVCECGYVGLPERRVSRDRRVGRDRRISVRMEGEDRRIERPRRKSDLNSWNAYGHL